MARRGTDARRLPTSGDLARAAGVSRTTVSYVLNDTPGARIPDETRRRVLEAAAELGYVANTAAADLRRGTSRTVLGVLDQPRAASLAFQYMAAMAAIFDRAGLTLVTTVVADEVTEAEAARLAAMRPVAAVVWGASLGPDARRILGGIGCVTIGDHGADVILDSDQGAVAVAGAQALLGRGRERLVQVLPAERSLAELAAAREDAFAAAAGPGNLGTRRLALDPVAARALVADLLDAPVQPDGIVAYNDEYAALLLGALIDAKVAVPRRVALIGADNSPWGERLRPSLSTLVLEPESATDQLVAAVDAIGRGDPLPERVVLGLRATALHRQTT